MLLFLPKDFFADEAYRTQFTLRSPYNLVIFRGFDNDKRHPGPRHPDEGVDNFIEMAVSLTDDEPAGDRRANKLPQYSIILLGKISFNPLIALLFTIQRNATCFVVESKQTILRVYYCC